MVDLVQTIDAGLSPRHPSGERWVDASADGHPRREVHLHRLLGVLGEGQPRAVFAEVAVDGADGRVAQLFLERLRCERSVQVPVDEHLRLRRVDDVALHSALVHLGHHVMERLAVSEFLLQRRVEAVQEPQLELVRAFEQVLQLAEA